MWYDKEHMRQGAHLPSAQRQAVGQALIELCARPARLLPRLREAEVGCAGHLKRQLGELLLGAVEAEGDIERCIPRSRGLRHVQDAAVVFVAVDVCASDTAHAACRGLGSLAIAALPRRKLGLGIHLHGMPSRCLPFPMHAPEPFHQGIHLPLPHSRHLELFGEDGDKHLLQRKEAEERSCIERRLERVGLRKHGQEHVPVPALGALGRESLPPSVIRHLPRRASHETIFYNRENKLNGNRINGLCSEREATLLGKRGLHRA